MSDNIKIYNYTRGSNYSVDVIVKSKDNIMFRNIVAPPNSSNELLMEFTEEAEKKVKLMIENGGD